MGRQVCVMCGFVYMYMLTNMMLTAYDHMDTGYRQVVSDTLDGLMKLKNRVSCTHSERVSVTQSCVHTKLCNTAVQMK